MSEREPCGDGRPLPRSGALKCLRLASEGGFGLAEAVVAIVVLSVGLLAVAGITLSVSAETRAGLNTTARVLAGQQVLEAMVQEGYSSVPTGDTTVTVGNRSFTVRRSIPTAGPRWKELRVEIQAPGGETRETLATRMHAHRPLPTSAP